MSHLRRHAGLICRAIVMIATFLIASALHAQSSSSDQNAVFTHARYAIEAWRPDDGLPENTATTVIQTRSGYIWVGTFNGIAQFDGIRFRVFDSSNTRGLANSRVTALHEDARGKIWIGHDNGEVTCWSNGVWQVMARSQGSGRTPVRALIEDERGREWALKQSGEAVCVENGQTFQPLPAMAVNPFANPYVARVAGGGAYVVRNGNVSRFDSSGFTAVDFRDPSEKPYYLGIAAAKDGNLWVLGESKLRKWNGTNWVFDAGEISPNIGTATFLLETTSGQIAIGTLHSGLFIFDPRSRQWTTIARSNGLPQDWVECLIEDSESNLWAGTHGGLVLLRERKVTMLNPPDDRQGRPFLSICRARDGSVWAATEGAGVYRLLDNQWTRHELQNPFVWSVLEDSRGQIWAGTWGGGLFRFEGDRFVLQSNLFGALEPVVALKESPPDKLWIGTGNGLACKTGDQIEHLSNLGGAAAGDVRAIEIAPSGDVWIGTQGSGLGRLSDGRLKTFLTEDGLPGNYIISLHHDESGTLWIGTLDMGLCRYKDGVFRTLNREHGLPANTVYHIVDDGEGNLWFNSPRGLFRVSKSQLNACADGKRSNVDILSYGKAEGMNTLAGTGGFTPSAFRAPDGSLWFSTQRGIAVVSPQNARPNPVSPPVWIEDVLVDGEAATPLDASTTTAKTRNIAKTPLRRIIIPPGRRQIDIQFTGLSYTSPERVLFKYRLQSTGTKIEWTQAGTRRRVTYPLLLPGEYLFQVAACNSDGLWNERGDTLAIVVLPFFWQTWWFKTLLAIASAALLGLLFYIESRRRIRRKLEHFTRERALERERARIAQDIHDDLGATLTRIGLLSETASYTLPASHNAAPILSQIFSTTRELTRSMDEIVWAVNPRHDTLESLTNYISRHAHDLLSAAGIRCRLALPVQLPDLIIRSEVRHNLFLASKEALHNVVKHSGAKEARISLTLLPDTLKIEIADNGRGFNLGKIPSVNATDHAAARNGLVNIKSRLHNIGGVCRIESTPGNGTTVHLHVPLALNPEHITPRNKI